MTSEQGTGDHARSREDKNPLQLSLFEAGSDDQP